MLAYARYVGIFKYSGGWEMDFLCILEASGRR